MLIGSAFPSFSWFIAPLCHWSVLFHPLVLLTQLSISARGLNCLFYLCRNVAWTKLQPHQFPLAIILSVFCINVSLQCSPLPVASLCCLPISSQNRGWKSGECESLCLHGIIVSWLLSREKAPASSLRVPNPSPYSGSLFSPWCHC